MADKKRKAAIIAAVILGCAALLYLGGMLGQLLENYTAWMTADGFSGQTEMEPVDWNLLACIPRAFTISGLGGMLGVLLLGGAVVLYVRLHDKFDGKTYDPSNVVNLSQIPLTINLRVCKNHLLFHDDLLSF